MHIIGGHLKGKALFTPKGDKTRPTTSRLRASIFNILQNLIIDASFLDIFAGSGAVGFEAFSRGAKEVFFIEQDRQAYQTIEKNITHLQITSHAKVLKGPYLQMLTFLEKSKQQFDVVFADAPYDLEATKDLVHWIDTHYLLKKGGYLFIENREKEPPITSSHLQWVNSRRSGHAYLHQFTS